MAYKKKTIVIGFISSFPADGAIGADVQAKPYTLQGHWSTAAVARFLAARGIQRGNFKHYSQFCEDLKSPVIYSDIFRIGY